MAIQARIADARARELCPDTLLLLEHPPTVTLGRRAPDSDVRWSRELLERATIQVVRVGRGGRATYHGPGQLVGYPIVRVPRRGRGVRDFVCGLEDVLIAVARGFGVSATRSIGHPGVWVGERKLGAIGIEVHRGISRHGFALNVDMDLSPFAAIVPCGMPGLEPIDLSRAAGGRVTMAEATMAVLSVWRSRFGEMREETWNECQAVG